MHEYSMDNGIHGHGSWVIDKNFLKQEKMSTWITVKKAVKYPDGFFTNIETSKSWVPNENEIRLHKMKCMANAKATI